MEGHNFPMWDFKNKSFQNKPDDRSQKVPAIRRNCQAGDCPHLGEFRAPKSRYDLRDYYWFCLDHVREYNKNWDFFKGMSRVEIEQHMTKSTIWDRPTWRMTEAGLREENTRQKIYEAFARGESIFEEFDLGSEGPQEAHINVDAIPHPSVEALEVMGLAPPVGWEEVRTRYKTLVKKYHPDTNKGDKEAEERLKKINLAYSILKISHQHFMKLDE